MDLLGEFFRHEIIGQVEGQLIVKVVNHIESDDLTEKSFGALVFAVLECLPRVLKEVSLAEGHGEILNVFVAFKHPDIVETSLLLHDLLLQDFTESSHLEALSHEDHVTQVFQTEHLGSLELRQFSLRKFWCVMEFLLRMGEDIFYHLLHEDFVVALCSHSTVGAKECITSAILGEISGTTASLTADPCCPLILPSNHGFHYATSLDDLSLCHFGLLQDIISK